MQNTDGETHNKALSRNNEKTTMTGFQGLYNIRIAKDTDHSFVISTMLKGLYYGESFFSKVPKNIFFNRYKMVVEALVKGGNANIRVACLPEDPDVIIAYSICSHDNNTVFYVFTKSAWRKRGIAKSLVPSKPLYVAHLTKVGESLLDKINNPKFNPFF